MLDLDPKMLQEYNSNIAFYIGKNSPKVISTMVFKRLVDSKNNQRVIKGDFEVKKLFLFNKPVDIIPGGYQGVMFIQCNIEKERILSILGGNDNIENVCFFE